MITKGPEGKIISNYSEPYITRFGRWICEFAVLAPVRVRVRGWLCTV